MQHEGPKIIAVLGPTASGKSALALDLARALGLEVVSADSLQVYKYLDIGTSKPPPSVRAEVPHHMLDLVEPDRPYNAGLYRRDAERVLDDAAARGRDVVLVGGTFLYVRVLLHGIIEGIPAFDDVRRELDRERAERGTAALYEELRRIDPEAAAAIHPNDYVRIQRALEVYRATGLRMSDLRRRHGFRTVRYDVLKIALAVEPPRLRESIERRTRRMVEQGLVDEVKSILDMGYDARLKPLRSIGYKEVVSHLRGEVTLERAVELIGRNTWRYARRQMTWLRKEPDLVWVDPDEERDRVIALAGRFLERRAGHL